MDFLILNELLFHKEEVLNTLELQQSQLAFRSREYLRDFNGCCGALLPLPLRDLRRCRILFLLFFFLRFVSHYESDKTSLLD